MATGPDRSKIEELINDTNNPLPPRGHVTMENDKNSSNCSWLNGQRSTKKFPRPNRHCELKRIEGLMLTAATQTAPAPGRPAQNVVMSLEGRTMQDIRISITRYGVQ
jgi:hypothetical protein